ncbi:hypothetical protein ACIBKY_17020 [Nonomuraea sp. NPDC050394]|uniref:hypothetical protein n=1 Tax=Nonomuraea sp. NPDC050394 TaxID=3364363 RepID=UPI003791E079
MSGRRWDQAMVRWLGYATVPAFAGAGFCLLALGVVTWLPALAAAAAALRAWREEGEHRVFTGVLRAFPGYLRPLLPHALASTAAMALLGANVLFLLRRPGELAGPLLWGQLGVLAVALVYHVHLAVAAARAPGAGARAWALTALRGFGAPGPSLAILGAAVAAGILTIVLPFGPLLYGPTVPLLLALHLGAGRG